MYYYLYDTNGYYAGMTETEPEHDRWTNTAPSFTNLKDKWNGSAWVESATTEEIEQVEKQKYNELDIEYTKKISDLVEKHVQKNIIDGTPIPKEVLDERERLKQDFYSLTNKDLKKGLRNEASKIGFPIPPKKP